LSAQELSRRRSTVESLERHLHGIDNRIAEREIIFLRAADDISLAEIADAEGGVVGWHGIFLLW
jgi:hypothetical protein